MSVAERLSAETSVPTETGANHDLPLRSFRVQNYRGFRDLTVPTLARINLFVGKNGAGKSALLEALGLYLTKGDQRTLRTILQRRGDYRIKATRDFWRPQGFRFQMFYAIENLFFGRPPVGRTWPSIQLGTDGDTSPLFIDFSWARSKKSEVHFGNNFRKPAPNERDQPLITFWQPRLPQDRDESRFHFCSFDVSSEELAPKGYSTFYDRASMKSEWQQAPRLDAASCFFLPETDVSHGDVLALWDDIVLSAAEDGVTSAVHLIAPSVERIAAIETVAGREFIVKVAGREEPFPLRNLGEGVNRLFRLAVALCWCRDGTLLLDEIETGLHWSIQPALWTLIFRLAERFHVQVFATTHSYDGLRGFGEAAKNTPEQGQLIRLEHCDGDIRSVEIAAEEVAIATEYSIELR